MITITINGTDRTDVVLFGTVQKTDAINQQTDTLNFDILYHPGQTFRPENNSEVIMTDGGNTVFAGKIYAVTKAIEDDSKVHYQVRCKDYSYDLGRELVNEEYDNMTVEEIIAQVIDDYAPTFTYSHVACPIPVVKVIFDRKSVIEVLQWLAEASGYSWYVEYDKDIHFFEKNTEPAPYNLTDGDGNCIPVSLQVSDDFSQIRNRVFIRGGEIEGDPRTEYFNGDATKKQFKLSNKFAHVPTVTVGGVAKNCGTDYLDEETAFDCFWDYNNQYVRFKDTTIPGAGTNNIEVTGDPLYNLTIQVEDPASILEYGLFEFSKEDKTVKSREVAVAMAKSELQAYKDGLIEGSFETYTAGLRSGQIIHIDSDILDVGSDFLIQRVTYKMLTITQGYWKIDLATLRTVGMIEFLINLLKTGDRIIEDEGNTILEKTVFPVENLKISDAIDINTDDSEKDEDVEMGEVVTVQALDYDTKFCWGPIAPTSTKRQFIWNGSRLG